MRRSNISGAGNSNWNYGSSNAGSTSSNATASSSHSRPSSSLDLSSRRSATTDRASLTRSLASRYHRPDLSYENYTDNEVSDVANRYTQNVADLTNRFGTTSLLDENTYHSLNDEAASLSRSVANRNTRYGSMTLGPRGDRRDDLVSRLSSFSDRYESSSTQAANAREEDRRTEECASTIFPLNPYGR